MIIWTLIFVLVFLGLHKINNKIKYKNSRDQEKELEKIGKSFENNIPNTSKSKNESFLASSEVFCFKKSFYL